jgi:hypothetical protein
VVNPEPAGVPPPAQSTLLELHSCPDVLAAIKADVLHKMNDAIDAQIGQLQMWFDQPVSSGGIAGAAGSSGSGGVADAPSASGGNAGSSSSGGAPSAGGSTTSSASDTPPATDYSQTNTQVDGIDEADIVKNDGKYIYLLHGNTFRVLNAWPAQSLASVSKTVVEGNPVEMFVANNKAVIFSSIDSTPFYKTAGIATRTWYYDSWGYYPYTCYLNGYGCWSNPVSKVTILDIDGTNATVERELYYEGAYLSSRRAGSEVRVIMQGATYGPQLKTYPDFSKRDPNAGPISRDEYIAAYEALRQQNTDAINATTPETWLPYSFTRDASGLKSRLTACDHFYVPTESTTQMGVTQVVTFDLTKPDPTQIALLGAVDTVYENDDSLVLSARAWISPKKLIDRPAGLKAPFIDYLPSSATYLHEFTLKTDPAQPIYVGSGSVPGQVNDQFSIDQRGDVLRIATTESRAVRSWISDDPNTRPFVNNFQVNRVFTMKMQNTTLGVIGDVGDLAPGESVKSARFVGDKGYVTTFRQIDPLFVIDLATPEQPKVLGHLDIPGFSEYMHPLDDGHLLTIGRDQANHFSTLALQIFDVTNPMQPTVMHKYVYDSSSYGYSEAEQNHKAFTYFASHKLLSFPFYGWSQSGFRSSAEVFKIDLDTGITPLGSVDHTKLFGTYSQGWCSGYFSPEVRRTLFIEDTLYSISYAGVIASDVANLSTPVATAALEFPTLVNYGPYCTY